MDGDEPIRLLGEFGHRSYLYLFSDGTIGTSGSEGASSNSEYFYMLPKYATEVSLIKGYGTEMGKPFYCDTDGQKYYITVEELQELPSMHDLYEKEILWTKLS